MSVSAPDHRHTIDIHLHVGLKTAAYEIIEDLCFLKGYASATGRDHKRSFDDIRKAVADAQRELDAYDAAIAAGRSAMTGDEWRAALAATITADCKAA